VCKAAVAANAQRVQCGFRTPDRRLVCLRQRCVAKAGRGVLRPVGPRQAPLIDPVLTEHLLALFTTVMPVVQPPLPPDAALAALLSTGWECDKFGATLNGMTLAARAEMGRFLYPRYRVVGTMAALAAEAAQDERDICGAIRLHEILAGEPLVKEMLLAGRLAGVSYAALCPVLWHSGCMEMWKAVQPRVAGVLRRCLETGDGCEGDLLCEKESNCRQQSGNRP
jgi:hypothetical protein